MIETAETIIRYGVTGLQEEVLLLLRIAVGAMFAISGAYKLFNAKRHKVMEETLEDAHIPKPAAMTYFVSANEFICGTLLTIGLLAVPAAGVLFIVTFVAFVTEGYEPRAKGDDFLFWLSGIFMRHEVLLALLLALVMVFGPGDASLDALIF